MRETLVNLYLMASAKKDPKNEKGRSFFFHVLFPFRTRSKRSAHVCFECFQEKRKKLFSEERSVRRPFQRCARHDKNKKRYIFHSQTTKKKGGGGLKKREKESLFLSSETETVHLVLPLSAAARQTQHILAGERKRDALDLIPSHLSR